MCVVSGVWRVAGCRAGGVWSPWFSCSLGRVGAGQPGFGWGSADAVEGLDQRAGPGPGGRDAEPADAGAAGESGGHV